MQSFFQKSSRTIPVKPKWLSPYKITSLPPPLGHVSQAGRRRSKNTRTRSPRLNAPTASRKKCSQRSGAWRAPMAAFAATCLSSPRFQLLPLRVAGENSSRPSYSQRFRSLRRAMPSPPKCAVASLGRWAIPSSCLRPTNAMPKISTAQVMLTSGAMIRRMHWPPPPSCSKPRAGARGSLGL